ncbi:DUF1992 domain-containing protein [Citrobacter sp. JGM124]|uniref:DnaJ family domain-containing protein n=1 Tax=Citrobacter sp. JGM124 TaxID=2799789 RepID=UPI001BA70A4D|nr:DUF1992 domain-containing protein [Citrobacter sp. JGM124]MBS0850088.1 DUF1992 domain-containing protein [Citrobacter sp. JGM124]
MGLLDDWAERHILEGQRNGDFNQLPGEGKPLILDDDSHVPAELRAGYRLLKNSGYLPPELLLRREAIELSDLLNSLKTVGEDYHSVSKKLALLELKLQQAGISTDFLHSHEYGEKLSKHIGEP